MGCCFRDVFKTTQNIVVWLPSRFLYGRFVKVQVVQLYNSNTATPRKNCRIISSGMSGFHMVVNLVNSSPIFAKVYVNITLYICVCVCVCVFPISWHRMSLNSYLTILFGAIFLLCKLVLSSLCLLAWQQTILSLRYTYNPF